MTSRHAHRVEAIVVTHGPDPALARSLSALQGRVRRTIVVANLPGFPSEPPPGGLLIENRRPAGFAANVNTAAARCTGEFVAVVNPDAVVDPDTIDGLVTFADDHPDAGILGPELRYPDGTWQPSRRSFPTILGTLVRRTPLRKVIDSSELDRMHYLLDERSDRPQRSDWLLGAFLFMRREAFLDLGGFDPGFRLYGEDIDLGYRAHQAGWEVWLVPSVGAEHGYHAVIDKRFLTRRTWWHLRGMARYAWKHPEALRRLR